METVNHWNVMAYYLGLMWVYVCLRIFMGVNMGDEFIDGIPLAIWQVGVLAWGLSLMFALIGSGNGTLPRLQLVRD
jgi:hypothetical protein